MILGGHNHGTPLHGGEAVKWEEREERLSTLIGSDWELVNEFTVLPISLADGCSVVGVLLPSSSAPSFALLTLFAL